MQCTGESGAVVVLALPEMNPNHHFEAELEFGPPSTSVNILNFSRCCNKAGDPRAAMFNLPCPDAGNFAPCPTCSSGSWIRTGP